MSVSTNRPIAAVLAPGSTKLDVSSGGHEHEGEEGMREREGSLEQLDAIYLRVWFFGEPNFQVRESLILAFLFRVIIM